ncbi:MAG: ATP-binding protein [Lysobacterales bacterium]
MQFQSLPERPLFRILGTRHGLPSSSVNKLAKDADGNIWLATLDGLARYDGIGFRVWQNAPDDPDSLPANIVEDLLVDEDNQVWAAPMNQGLVRYRPADGGFDHWRHDPDDADSLPGNRIWAMAGDGAGGLWLGGFGTGLIHMQAGPRFRRWQHDPERADSLCGDHILSLKREGGELWIGTSRGLCRHLTDHDDDRFQTIAIPEHDGLPALVNINGILPVGDVLWLASSTGMRGVATGPDATPSPHPPAALATTGGTALTAEPDGALWYASYSSIRRWHPGTGEMVIHRARPGRALVLQEPRITDALRDDEGSLWFSSLGGGVAQLVPRWRAVRAYLADPDNPAGLPGSRVQMVNRDRAGRLWVVVHGSSPIAELDAGTGLVRRWLPADADDPLPDRSFLTALHDRHGALWTSHRGSLARYELDSGNLRVFSHDDDGQSLPTIQARLLVEHPDGHLIAAFGGGGIAIVDSDKLGLRLNPLGRARDLPCTEVRDIRFDADGGIWMACDHGLLHAAGPDQPVRAVPDSPAGPVDSLDFSPDGQLWLHSQGQLLGYRVEDGRLHAGQHPGPARGWPALRIGGLIADADGIVWAATPRGLYAYDPGHDRVEHYDEEDGLPNTEFSATPPVRLGPYLMAAGTLTGPVVIDTRALRAPSPVARLGWYQASIVRGNRPQTLSLANGDGLKLGHDDRELRVAVRLGSLIKPGSHRYRFRLQGHDHGWIEQVGQPERLFERLASGHYQLEVHALSASDQAAANALQLSIQVQAPPWRRPWAWALYALAAAALLLAAHRTSRRRLLRRQALALAEERQLWAEQANQAKTRFLTDIGHDVRTPMAGLMGMNDLLLRTPLDGRQRHYAQSVRNAGRYMLTLINDLLDHSRIEAGKLELVLQPVHLADLADQLIVDVAAAAETAGSRLSVRIEPGVALVVLADGRRLTQILLNFLNNAIKFAAGGRIRLILDQDGGHTRFRVEDEGPGLPEDVRSRLFHRYAQDDLGRRSGGTGLGLAINRDLSGLMGGQVGVDNLEPRGASFWLRLPLTPAPASVDPITDDDTADSTGVWPDIDPDALPPLHVHDDDRQQADDLVISLRSLGARASHWQGQADGLVLLRCEDPDALPARLAELARPVDQVIASLPLEAVPPAALAGLQVLSGPWQLGSVLRLAGGRHGAGVAGDLGQAATSSVKQTEPRPETLAGMHLLLIEDDPVLREVMSIQLGQLGAGVTDRGNGLAALAELDHTRFDAILLDLDLPELDGLRLLQMIRGRLGERTPPVIIITARQDADDQARCRAAGARAFYRKPVDPAELAQTLLAVAR